ncbi:MAG: hypothetical protein ABW092_10985 [Candidatus Thiodiazotropha sp.]
MSANSGFAENSSIGVITKNRQDIDYDLYTLGLSATLITPYGLFHCDPALLTGETRIDSFNNIVGIADVRDAEWKRISAHDLECRYGAKWRGAGGVFKGGLGFRDYLGRTDDEPGGKVISIEGAGALLDFAGDGLDARFEWKRESHDYILKHQTSIGNYNSLTDATDDTYTATGVYGKLYLSAKHVTGNKDNDYTTPLFPANEFHYDYTDMAIGMSRKAETAGLTLVAPILGKGAYRGSFNPLQGDSGLKGLRLAGRLNGYEIDLEFLRHKGEGSRPYLPATENLTEHETQTTIAIAINKDGWRAGLEHVKSIHTANALLAAPIYASIIGGYGPFENKRAEEKWTLSVIYPLLKRVTADLSLYHTARHDRQFLHPEHNYTENGGFLKLIFSDSPR